MASFDVIRGRKVETFDQETFADLCARYRQVALDVGTGDGRYVLDLALELPDVLCCGVDPVAEAMERSSRESIARKGGRRNALFLRASLEQLPGPFEGVVDRLSVNYPWGSLLASVATADLRGMRQLRSACKTGATLSVYLNYSVFEDRAYSERLGLEAAQEFLESGAFMMSFRAAGFTVVEHRIFEGDPPFRSAWGRQLVRGSRRRSMHIEARATDASVD